MLIVIARSRSELLRASIFSVLVPRARTWEEGSSFNYTLAAFDLHGTDVFVTRNRLYGDVTFSCKSRGFALPTFKLVVAERYNL
ncbi:hypothetical protein KPH14_003011 [Odynerus spinipes]|uniref:Uncharacterized protein n=1 Tax=Odynerus spinipes TaxID=1348599 RepID=A0AAD9RY14_9HYME|nr:hypothetical protein KPH14_003011 [Odynerus spinipes]